MPGVHYLYIYIQRPLLIVIRLVLAPPTTAADTEGNFKGIPHLMLQH